MRTIFYKHGPTPQAHSNTEVDPAIAGQVGSFDPLTPVDRQILDGLTKPELRPDQILPGTTKVRLILPALELCCGAMKAREISARKINPIIGRLMVLIRDNPEIYRNLGHQSFNRFCINHLNAIGYHRSSVYIAMRLVELHPKLILQDWVEIGMDRLAWLSKICKYGDPSYNKYLKAAREMETRTFRLWLARQGLIEPDDFRKVPVVFTATRTTGKELYDFVKNPKVHEVVGSTDMGRIIGSMVQECSSEWLQADKRLTDRIGWRCDWCHETGTVDLRRERTLDGLVRIVGDQHREKSEDCDFADQPGSLVISSSCD